VKILIACEYSGVVRDAFLAKGHDALSCDLLPTEAPGPHYQGDVRDVLFDEWDMLIAHPPCTALCVSGNRWYAGSILREEALEFFRLFLDAPCDKICVENPVGVVSSKIRPPTQYVQPWQFGHRESKATGLWLKGLPKLVPTEVLELPERGYWDNQTPSGQNRLGPSVDRGKIRSRTYEGIAAAMAEQWGEL